jgi:AraC family transcriptional regulator, regulatory protein of adaptative response / DNA-3-methyladenine glycosylase II
VNSVHQNPKAAYKAFKAHDARFDGHVFAGVSSTGIYCRPVCRVRTPMFKNCRFFSSAAAAEAEGFRPCLRCRPELAPGRAAVDASAQLARRAAIAIDDALGTELDLQEIAAKLGVTDRHLRRAFALEFGASPVQYAQTQRLLLAKRLLTDTGMSVTTAAFASGFSSVRRMNALFQARYRLTPSALRQRKSTRDLSFVFQLAYRPPYDWQQVLAFLEKRAVLGVERITGKTYARTLRLDELVGDIQIRALEAKQVLEVTVSSCFARALPRVLALVKRVFDLHADPLEIASHLKALKGYNPGLRLPGAFDPFELGVRAILGQQITVRAARTMVQRFAAAFGTPHEGDKVAFPTAASIAALDLRQIAELGIVRARAEAILCFARSMRAGAMEGDAAEVQSKLQALKGIGPWTAAYIAMRALSWPDAWLPGDVALLCALREPNTAAGRAKANQRAESWRPWRSYAVLHLWNSLETS